MYQGNFIGSVLSGTPRDSRHSLSERERERERERECERGGESVR